jgi:hypothetical protein
LRRLVTIGASTAVVAGMSPFLGAVAANAAVGQVFLANPVNGTTISAQTNGTDSQVHLLANVIQATGGDAHIVSVQFLACDATVTPACVPTSADAITPLVPVTSRAAGADANGNDAFAAATWTVPAPGHTYDMTANGLDANSVSVPALGQSVVSTSTAVSNVAITRPADDSKFGYNPTTGLFNVAGTSTLSTDAVTARTLPGGTTTAATHDTLSQKWAVDLNAGTATLPTAIKDSSVTVRADIGGVQVRQIGEAYLQKLATTGGLTTTPATAFSQSNAVSLAGGDTPAQIATKKGKIFTFKATDQNGNPISGLQLALTSTDPNNDGSATACTIAIATGNAGTCLPVPNGAGLGTVTTNAFGQFQVAVNDSENESVTINAKSQFDGVAYNPTVDYDVTATFTTAAQTVTSGTATVVGHPVAPIYPEQTYGVIAGLPQNGPSPVIAVAVKDANSQPVVSKANAVQYSYVRTVTAGKCAADTNTYPLTTAGQNANSDASGNAYVVPNTLAAPAAPGVAFADCGTEAGNDVFTIYLENNGTPGFQTGSSDVLVATQTLAFGPEQIYFSPCDKISTFEGGPQANCKAQQKSGTDKTLSIMVGISDGTAVQPIANRKIDIDLAEAGTVGAVAGTDYGFSSANNTGLTKLNAKQGDITTDANGVATVTVFDNKSAAPETLTVTASDPTLGASTAEDGKVVVTFRNYSAVLNTSTASNAYSSDGQISPLNSGASVGAPGQPLIQCFAFQDQNNTALANESISLTTNAGFFTDLPNGGATKAPNDKNYVDLHFDTPIADGQPIKGDLHSNGQSAAVVTDGNGVGCFNLGILTASHFAVDGTVSGTVTAQLGGSGSTLNVDNNKVLFSTDAGNFGVQALNPGTMAIVQGRFDNNNKFQVQSGKPSGEKATASKNTVPIDTVNTIVEQTDSFGNPISEPVKVTSTGSGVLGTVNQTINGAYDNIQNAASNSALVGADVAQVNDPNADNPATGDQTVSYDWTAAKTTGLVNTTTKATAVNATTQDLKDSYTVTWYVRDPTLFHYVTKMTPGHKEHAGTPITTSVTVTDNELRAVQGLGVEFIRSGPAGQTQDTGNPNTCNQFSTECTNALFTDVQGKTGFTFNSTKVGKFTITTIVTDASGNEVGRSVSTGKLTAAKAVTVTIHATKHSYKKHTRHKLSGSAPAGHDVKIYRGGHKVATVLANNKGHWHKTLKFNKNHKYFARSNGHKSKKITVKVHK